LRDLAHDSNVFGEDEGLEYDYPGIRVQFLGTAQALRMAADEIDRLRLDMRAISDLTVADRPYDWRLDEIGRIARAEEVSREQQQ
jgi:hypothetical protein